MNDDELIACYIVPDPHKSSKAEARVKDRWVSVWALTGLLQGGANGDLDAVAGAYDISREAMEAALAYYRRNKNAIDARLDANNADDKWIEAEDDTIRRFIEPNPHKAGKVEARLIGYGVAVWALVADWLAENQDVNQVARSYDVPNEAVEAALAFYRRHKDLLDGYLEADAA